MGERTDRADAASNRTYLSGVAVALALFGAFGGLVLCVSLFGQLGEGGHRSTPG